VNTRARSRRFDETAIKTRANVVTLLRLLFSIPVVIWILQEHRATWGTFSGWLVLWFTDGLDGWLARRDGTTRSGAFLDPLADKVLVLAGFVAVAARSDLPWWPVAIIAVREVIISAYRSVVARRGISIPARPLGKWKTNVQFFAVALVLCPPTEHVDWLQTGALWFAAALTVVSAVDLLVKARPRSVGTVRAL
jgi:CDP-diacylglycerol--glycerol-3-phosphate 3-phosphatidyltransferase